MPETSENPSPESPQKPEKRRDPKRRGQVAELAFMHKAADLGFAVTKPYGDTEAYDFILDAGHRLWRVQVRSTDACHDRHGYRLHTVHGGSRDNPTLYDPTQIDFLVAYIVAHAAWYVIPVGVLGSRRGVTLYPQNPTSSAQFEKFREAWCLMACPYDGTPNPNIIVDRPCAACPRKQPSAQ